MRLDWALLATAAEGPPNGLVYILGAGIDTLWREQFPAGFGGTMVLRLLTTRLESERPHKVEVHCSDEDGGAVLPQPIVLTIPPRPVPPDHPHGEALVFFDIADSDRSLSRQITELLELIRQYGPDAVAGAIEKAATARAFGADYVANILRQQQCPRREQPPLRLRDPRLNELATDPLSLLAYDAFILQSEKESDDTPGTETPRSESDGHEPPSGDDPL